MNTFIANMKHAVRNRETVVIGGGEFQAGELATVIDHIEQLQGAAENSAREDAAAVAGARRPYARYLERVEQSIADINLTCWYDFEPADRSVGLPATAWLIHARPAGSPCDIADILDSRVIKRLEREAAEALDQESEGPHGFD